MTGKDIYHKNIKEFFNRIGLEKASPDFTANVMSRIQVEPGYERIQSKPLIPYYLAAMIIMAMFLALPFGNYLVNFTNDLIFKISAIDYSFINRFITSLIDTIGNYSVSSTVIIVLSLSTTLFCIMMIVNLQSFFYKNLHVHPV